VAPERSAVFQAGLAEFERETHERLFGADLVALLGGEALEQLALVGRLDSFLADAGAGPDGTPIADRLGGWLAEGRVLKGARIICYHVNWSYFEDRFGVECADYVESKPGISPTPRHVAQLLDLMRNERLGVILAASYFDGNRVRNVADRGGATAIIVPMQTQARPGLDSYFDLVDLWIDQLTGALQR
jgi:hypothetical protein